MEKDYNISQMDQLISIAKDFATWLREKHPEITKISDLGNDLAREFFGEIQEQRKARLMADKETLMQFARQIKLRTTEFEYLRVSDFDLECSQLLIRRRGTSSEKVNISDIVVEIVRKHIIDQDLGGDDKLFELQNSAIHDLLLRKGLLRHMEVYEKLEVKGCEK